MRHIKKYNESKRFIPYDKIKSEIEDILLDISDLGITIEINRQVENINWGLKMEYISILIYYGNPIDSGINDKYFRPEGCVEPIEHLLSYAIENEFRGHIKLVARFGSTSQDNLHGEKWKKLITCKLKRIEIFLKRHIN